MSQEEIAKSGYQLNFDWISITKRLRSTESNWISFDCLQEGMKRRGQRAWVYVQHVNHSQMFILKNRRIGMKHSSFFISILGSCAWIFSVSFSLPQPVWASNAKTSVPRALAKRYLDRNKIGNRGNYWLEVVQLATCWKKIPTLVNVLQSISLIFRSRLRGFDTFGLEWAIKKSEMTSDGEKNNRCIQHEKVLTSEARKKGNEKQAWHFAKSLKWNIESREKHKSFFPSCWISGCRKTDTSRTYAWNSLRCERETSKSFAGLNDHMICCDSYHHPSRSQAALEFASARRSSEENIIERLREWLLHT